MTNPVSHVLVVDDDISTRMLARRTLEQLDLEVSEAGTGPEALAAFERRRPDLILLDVGLPGFDGFVVAERVRADPHGGDVPIIMLTGRNDAESVGRAYASGATDFASKPVSWLVLGQRVLYLLRSALDQRRLVLSEARLQEAQRVARIAGWEMDLDSGAITASDGLTRLFKIAPESGAAAFLDLLHEDDRDLFLSELRRVAGMAMLLGA